jgi:hypothetical protein
MKSKTTPAALSSSSNIPAQFPKGEKGKGKKLMDQVGDTLRTKHRAASPAGLLSSNQTNLYRMDQAFHPFSRQAAPQTHRRGAKHLRLGF